MLATVIEILNYITLSQLFLFCIFFILKKQGNLLSNKLLALIFLCYALNFSTYYTDFQFVGFFKAHFPRLIWLFEPFSFCIGPLLYLYTMSLVRSNFKLMPKHIAFFIPFFVYLYFTITTVTIQSPETIRKIVDAGGFLSLLTYFVLYTFLRISNVLVAAISLVALFRYKKQLKTGRQPKTLFDVKWQLIVLSGMSIVFLIEFMYYVDYYASAKYLHSHDKLFFVTYFLINISIMFLLINILVFSGLKNSSLFEVNKIQAKYSKSLLVDNEKEMLLQRVRECMVQEKYFLTPSITVQHVAEKIGSQPRLVSQVINELSGQNFIDFVNSYRIEEAKKMLIDRKFKGYSIIGILYEVGFNSKTAFNTTFKKQTGLTPKEYKQIRKACV
jgi:AraC-like DNA-binding protein